MVAACATADAPRPVVALLAATGLRRRAIDDTSGVDMQLVATEAGLELRVLTGPNAGGRAARVDLAKLDTASGPGRALNQPLLKAVGIKRGEAWRPVVIDACGGLGEDAWLLASFGCRVLTVERQPVIAAMLADALRRAGEAAPGIASRLTMVTGDARVLLAEPHRLPEGVRRPDVVYLDPMYPGHAGRRAAARKPLRVLRDLAGDDVDAPALFDAAMAVAARRVVVKRPRHAEAITERVAPVAVHTGKAMRFDVYVPGLGEESG